MLWLHQGMPRSSASRWVMQADQIHANKNFTMCSGWGIRHMNWFNSDVGRRWGVTAPSRYVLCFAWWLNHQLGKTEAPETGYSAVVRSVLHPKKRCRVWCHVVLGGLGIWQAQPEQRTNQKKKKKLPMKENHVLIWPCGARRRGFFVAFCWTEAPGSSQVLHPWRCSRTDWTKA